MEYLSLPSGFSFSQSSLQDYYECPRRFQLRYIQRLQWPAVDTEPVQENERRQQEGQAFHLMIQQRLIGLPVEKLGQNANTPDLSRWWGNFLETKLELPGYNQHIEITLVAPVGNYRLLAKYDLVSIKSHERVLIYDWKTYHKRPRDEWMIAHLQTRVYRALLVQTGACLNSGSLFLPEQITMVYWYANFPSEPAVFPYNTAQFNNDWEALTGLINEISNHRHFPMTEDEKKCTYCPYRSYCNRGCTAGTQTNYADPESFLGEITFEQIPELEF